MNINWQHNTRSKTFSYFVHYLLSRVCPFTDIFFFVRLCLYRTAPMSKGWGYAEVLTEAIGWTEIMSASMPMFLKTCNLLHGQWLLPVPAFSQKRPTLWPYATMVCSAATGNDIARHHPDTAATRKPSRGYPWRMLRLGAAVQRHNRPLSSSQSQPRGLLPVNSIGSAGLQIIKKKKKGTA